MDEAERAFGARKSAADGWLIGAGLLLVLAGAVAVFVACVGLDFVRTPADVELLDNRAVFHEVGVYALAGAVGAPSLALGRWRGVDIPWWIVSMLGVCGILLAGVTALVVGDWSLYDLDWNGPNQPSSYVVEPAVAVWTIGLGSALVAFGGWLLARIPPLPKKAPAAVRRLPPEGWYHDPEHAQQLRWWDGDRWSGARRPLAPLNQWDPPQAPGAPAAPVSPGASASASSASSDPPADRPAGLWARPHDDPPQDG